jgi:hypothetical protein
LIAAPALPPGRLMVMAPVGRSIPHDLCHSAARDRMEVKLFLSKARTKTERILFQSKLGNKRQADQSSLQREFASDTRRK